MNKFWSLLLFSAVGVFSTFAAEHPVEFNPEPKSPRIIKVGKTPVITLSENGKPSVEIVCTDTSQIAKIAARDLARFLGRMLGAKLRVLSKASGNVPVIYVGKSAVAEKAGLDPYKLEGDGYYIKTVGRDICIIGADRTIPYRSLRGTMFGVYEFLERFGGARFYFPGVGTIIPEHKTLTIPEIDITDRPDDMLRFAHILDVSKSVNNEIQGFYWTGFTKEQIIEIRKYWRFSELLPHMPHGMNHLKLSPRFGKDHPEYFALHKGVRVNGINVVNWMGSEYGHPCFSSEGLKEELYKDCAAVLTHKAASRGLTKLDGYNFTPPLVAIMPPDALLWCQCEKCRKCVTSEQRSVVVWRFMTDIAKKLKDEKVPGFFGIYAYEPFADVPEDVDVPDNVVFMLAEGSAWEEKLRPAHDNYAELVKGWRKKTGKPIFTWVYPTKLSGRVPYFPNVTPLITGKFLKRHAKDIRGWFWEAESDRWMFAALDAYIFSKAAWNNSIDPKEIFNEYCQTMFGAAADTMKEFYATVEKAWLSILNDTMPSTYGPRWRLHSEYDIWQKIFTDKEIARVNALFDKAEKLVAGNKDTLERVKFIRDAIWQPVTDAKNRFAGRQVFDSVYTYTVKQKTSNIILDGKLNEKAWHHLPALWLTGGDGKATDLKTSIKILQDSENYYVAIEAEEPMTDKMAVVSQKDDDGTTWQDNCFELFFYPSSDADYYWQLIVNSKNGKSDFRGSADRKVFDVSQNSNWETAVTVNKGKSWVAEIRIPKSFMPDVKGNTIKASFQRHRFINDNGKRTNKYYVWRPRRTLSANEFGTLNIADDPNAPKKIYAEYFSGKARMYNGKGYIGRWHSQNDKIFLDKQHYITGGGSLRLQAECDRARLGIDKLKPSTKYKISYVVKHENVEKTSEFYMVMYWGPQHYSGKDRLSGTAPWTKYEYVFTTPPTRKYSILEFNCRNTKNGKVWIDSLEIEEVK